ncbi:Na/Pi symporter [Robertmurraya massiliosenegalensis]|uniref:Na/Pi symporter n=1 Tax=Robertmurraya TaxID=2837507 RepID=UPI0039A68528
MLHILAFILFIIIFLVGMTFLRTGLFNASVSSLKHWLVKLTDTPFKGLLVGTIVTGILQSSSAVMVMTIGLISAKMLTFKRSIGIILGTNIGTTFTTEFITFNIDSAIVPIAIAGAILAVMKKAVLKSIGFVLLGLALIFTAMNGFEILATPIAGLPWMNEYTTLLNNNLFVSVMAGIVITMVIQSSTATTGIAMGFLSSDVIGIDAGIAIMLGANIGTCITAFLASIGGGKESQLCAYAHIWLNFVGVIVFYPFIPYLSELALSLANEPDVQLAHISLVFNCVSSLIVLPFANKFADFILKVHGK